MSASRRNRVVVAAVRRVLARAEGGRGWLAHALSVVGKHAWPPRGALLAVALAVTLAPLALAAWVFAWSYGVALPSTLTARSGAGVVVVRDRDGGPIVRSSGDGSGGERLDPDALPSDVVRAVLAAEDRRFFSHHGVDSLAVARALGQALAHGRVVSGASTITQQLARLVAPHPRTLGGKLYEMAVALRIERTLSKRQVLAEYLARAPFGPRLRGVEDASRAYFNKPASALSLGQAAFLAGLPRGPSLYNPRRGVERALRRRDRVLERLVRAGQAGADEVRRASAERVTVSPLLGADREAAHFVGAVLDGGIDAPAGTLAGRASEIETTLDAALQREVAASVVTRVAELAGRHVSAASVVVVDNASGDVLAYVGSPGVDDAARLGANDGARALRQPGSSLKPFVYELAMETLGWTPATLLPDVSVAFASPEGVFRPANYDGQFHGPVRLREALANSYNIPAAYAASLVGPAELLRRLRALGLTTLDRSPEAYGEALALGDGEVRLVDLAAAYATLARGGERVELRAVRRWREASGGVWSAPERPVARRVLRADEVAAITDILTDERARLATFGDGLSVPFKMAVKTGTSKGFRDNVAVGFTPRITVAVWAGNFDGSAMRAVSGVSGAGPILRDVMMAAVARYGEGTWATSPLVEAEVCSLSGRRAGPHCDHRRKEVFVLGTQPRRACETHQSLAIDRRNGLLAGPGCDSRFVRETTFETYAGRYEGWAREAGRPLAPTSYSPHCPGHAAAALPPLIDEPVDGAHFVFDPTLPTERQALAVELGRPVGESASLFVDDRLEPATLLGTSLLWRVRPGEHRLRVESKGGRSNEVKVFVDR